jgi:hypothetical protein
MIGMKFIIRTPGADEPDIRVTAISEPYAYGGSATPHVAVVNTSTPEGHASPVLQILLSNLMFVGTPRPNSYPT